MSVFYSVGSIILGFFAIIFPIINMFQQKKNRDIQATYISFSACVISLLIQIFHIRSYVIVGDFSAIEDTINVLSIVSLVFVVVVIIINLITISRKLNH